MVFACSQVSVQDCGNANVGNLGVVMRVRNRAVCVCVCVWRVASLTVSASKVKERTPFSKCNMRFQFERIHVTPTERRIRKIREEWRSTLWFFLPFLQSTKGHMHVIRTIDIGRHNNESCTPIIDL